MNKTINVALIGYGYWGQKLYRYLKESHDFNLQYVFFPSLKKYNKTFIQQHFGTEFVSDLEVVWQDINLSSVIIATPIETHFDIVLSALSHKKHVLVEKPLTIQGEDAIKLAQFAQMQKLVLETEYTYTYSKALKQAQQIIHSGLIGKIKSISIELKQLGRFSSSDVYLLLGSHALSMLNLFLPITDLNFTTFPLIVKNNITTAALINFKTKNEDCQGYVDLNLHCPKREKKLFIYGEKGTIIYYPDQKESLAVILYKYGKTSMTKDLIEKEQFFIFDETNNLKYAIENFQAVINKKTNPNLNSSIAINQILNFWRQKRCSKV